MLTLNEIYYTITYVLHHSVGDFVIPSSFLSFTDSLVILSSFLSFTDSLVIPSSFPSFTDSLVIPSSFPSFTDNLVIPSSFPSFTDNLVIPSSFPSFTDSLVIPSSFPNFTDNLDFSCLIVAVSSSCLASSGTVCLLSLTYFRILSQEQGYCWYALNSNKVSLSDINNLFQFPFQDCWT